MATTTLLRRGQTFVLGGLKYRVAYVNPSRAHCVATVQVPVTIGEKTFMRKRKISTDISPNTCLEVLREVVDNR